MTHATLTADGTWAAASGSGSETDTGTDTQGYAGVTADGHPVDGGTVAGAGTETDAEATTYTAVTASTLDPAAGTWATTGTLDSTATGVASSSYQGTGSYASTATADGTYGPTGLEGTGTESSSRQGTATESGTADSDYQYVTHATLTADGTWAAASGSGSETDTGTDAQGYTGVTADGYPVDSGTVAGAGTETDAESSTYTAAIASVLDPSAGTWATTGTLDSTATGVASSSYQGTGSYASTATADGTYGPTGLEGTGTESSSRQGTATESGTADSDYQYVTHATLTADGTWAAASGSGSETDTGTDAQGYTGVTADGYPVDSGTVAGAGTETDAESSTYTAAIASVLDPSAGTWATTGTLDSTATGVASSSYQGTGSYASTATADGTYGPTGLEGTGTESSSRQGTATESGTADSDYQYVTHATLTADGTWAAASGSGSETDTGTDAQGYTGVTADGYPVDSGTVAGAGTETDAESSTYTAAIASVLDPSAGTWATTGTLDSTATGVASSSYQGSGTYGYGWQDSGTYGPAGLEGTGAANYQQAGTATESGTADSDYQYVTHATLTADGTWVAVSGSGSETDTGTDTEGYTGTLGYSYPVDGGTVSGVISESNSEGASYSTSTTSTLDPMAGTWTTTGILDTTATGTATSSYQGSGAYGYGWQDSGTYGPAGLEGTGTANYQRDGTETESGVADSDYQYATHATLTADGTWAAVSGSGSETDSGFDEQGYSGTIGYNYPVQSGTVFGVTAESESAGTSYSIQTASVLDPVGGTWATTGTLDTTATGAASSSSQGSGTYGYGWQNVGTYGPTSLQVTGYETEQRACTVTGGGTTDSSYQYVAHGVLTPDGSWALTNGSEVMTDFGFDWQGFSGTIAYNYPIAGGVLYGVENESESEGTSYSDTTLSVLDPVAGTWATTGTLDSTATGTAMSSYQGSGSYAYGWGVGGTFGPTSLQTTGDETFQRQGVATDVGTSDSSYQYITHGVLTADGTWAVVSGTGSETDTGTDEQGYSGTIGYAHPITYGQVTGTITESDAEGTSYSDTTSSVLDPVAGTWSTTGTLDTAATGTATSSYQGSGSYVYGWWVGGTFGPTGLQGGGYENFLRQGVATDDGTADSSYQYATHSTLTATGSWAAVSGTGSETATQLDEQGYTGSTAYNYPVEGGTEYGMLDETEAEGTSSSLQTSSVLDPVAGTWSTTGTLDTAATGTATSSYQGSGSYVYGWWVGGTFGPTGLQGGGYENFLRQGVATDDGTADSSYQYATHSTLTAAGTWAAVSGTGSETATQLDEQGYTGSTAYNYPVEGGTEYGTLDETEAEGTSSSLQTSSVLDPVAGTWSTTGTLDTAATGTATSSYQGSGSYVYGWWVGGTFGPTGLQGGGYEYFLRQGVATDDGTADSSYQYATHSTLTAAGTWAVVSGTGTSTDTGLDEIGYGGTNDYNYPVLGGTVYGTITESDAEGTSYSDTTSSVLDPVAGTWATTGALDSTATGATSSSYQGSGSYAYGWWVGGTFGPTGLQGGGYEYFERQGVATDDGTADSSYQYATHSTLTPDGTWAAVSGTGTSTGTGLDEVGYSGTNDYNYPVLGGTVYGTITESDAEGTSYSDTTSSVLDPVAGTWSTTGTLDTAATGTASSSYQGSGSYAYGWWVGGTFGPTGLQGGGYENFLRQGVAADDGTADSTYQYATHSTLTAAGTWAAVSGTGTSTGTGLDEVGYSGTNGYNHPILSGTVYGTITESDAEGTSYSDTTSSVLDPVAGTWATTGTLDTTATGTASSSYQGSGSYAYDWWVGGTFGPSGLQAGGYQNYQRGGTATDGGTADSSYQYVTHSTLTAGGSWVAVSGTGSSTETGLDEQGYSGTSGYNHPIDGGTVYGTIIESDAEDTSYSMQTSSVLDPVVGTWATTGTLGTGATGAATSSYQGAGAYLHSVDGQSVPGTLTESGSAANSYQQEESLVLAPDGTWQVTTGTWDETGSSVTADVYSGSTTFSEDGSAYFVALGTAPGSGSVSEAGSDGTTSGYQVQYVIGDDGEWDVLGGTAFASGSGSWDSDYSVDGTYSDGSWQMSETDSASYQWQTASTLGTDGSWTTTGSSDTSGTGSGTESYTGSSSGPSTSSGSTSSSEHFSYGWSDSFDDTSVLASDGSVTTTSSGQVIGIGSGGGGGTTTTHVNTSSPGGSYQSDSTDSWTWTLNLTQTQTWQSSSTTTYTPAGVAVTVGQSSGSTEEDATITVQDTGSGTYHSFGSSDGGSSTTDGTTWSTWTSTDNYQNESAWSQVVSGDGSVTNTSTQSDHVWGTHPGSWGSAWTTSSTDADGDTTTESGSGGDSSNDSYDTVIYGGPGFADDWYAGGYGARPVVAEEPVGDVEPDPADDTPVATAEPGPPPEVPSAAPETGTDEEGEPGATEHTGATPLPPVGDPEESFEEDGPTTYTPGQNTKANLCFAGGTQIRTPDGLRVIESLRAGDRVLSRDEHNPAGKVEPKVIEEVFARTGLVWEICLGGHTFRTTAEHPFYAWDRGWTAAHLLGAGDSVLTEDGQWVAVGGSRDAGVAEMVFNFRVADYHTYFVGVKGGGARSGHTMIT
ncbi:hypothetical protein FRUB_04902 [Fimbriiglobus ruber]|uniref:Hint domain-containing protein n=2 Tax=Fimbriiglobus ruber TaxID=1908690 RepID=A0A225DHP0_9BACT|nr:hypothetical protein FRUB_04902 [Fimbriiglobus ruber]